MTILFQGSSSAVCTAADSKLGRLDIPYCKNKVKKFWNPSKSIYCQSLTYFYYLV
jgi:hypothetical protein